MRKIDLKDTAQKQYKSSELKIYNTVNRTVKAQIRNDIDATTSASEKGEVYWQLERSVRIPISDSTFAPVYEVMKEVV